MPGAESTTKVFLQNVKVLAVGQEVDNGDKTRLHATPATVATLLVSPQDAERLVLAQNEGRIMLTLRSWTDSAAGRHRRRQPVRPGRRRPRSRRKRLHRAARRPIRRGRRGKGGRGGPPPPPTLTAEAPAPKDTVEILRGDRFEQRNFNRGDKR